MQPGLPAYHMLNFGSLVERLDAAQACLDGGPLSRIELQRRSVVVTFRHMQTTLNTRGEVLWGPQAHQRTGTTGLLAAFR